MAPDEHHQFLGGGCLFGPHLDLGRKLFEGTPEAVHADPGVRQAYLGAAAA
jgi:hypothetical protein